MQPRLLLTDFQKSFGATTVLHGVNLTVQPGEVHGLLGENGAGKSTMLNILSGVLRADTGRIEIDGRPVTVTSPRDAAASGIAMIHQELQQVPELNVAQNIFLGHSLRKGPFVDRRWQKAEARRWLAAGTEIFLFDEPTRSIDVGAKAEIYALIERLAQQGKAVLFVSSELPEVIRLADRVLVMREGRIAATLAADQITDAAIAHHAIPSN